MVDLDPQPCRAMALGTQARLGLGFRHPEMSKAHPVSMIRSYPRGCSGPVKSRSCPFEQAFRAIDQAIDTVLTDPASHASALLAETRRAVS